jgi:superfamily II DNA or RNA helicase
MTELRQIRARADGEIVLYDLPAKTLERLTLKLSLTNPKYAALKQFNRFTGTEPERIYSAVEMPDGSLHCPRGAFGLIREECFKDGLVPKIEIDERADGTSITIVKRDYLPPRDYQAQGVDEILRKLQGLIVLPCGTGKTKLGGYAILAVKRTTLVIVHTTDLADQWLEDLRSFGIEAGLVGAGKTSLGHEVVVGIVDSVVDALETMPEWGKRFGMVLVDECHHTPAATFQRALRLLPARRRVGLTATPEREDSLTWLVGWSFGPTLLERSTIEMIKLGYLMPAKIEIVHTGWTWTYDGPEKKRLATLEKDIAEDISRNAMIADRVAVEAKTGETCLVLARTRAHCKELAEMICARGVEAHAVTGRSKKKDRRSSIGALRAGDLPVMVATSLADEGLDLPRLSYIALASPQRARGVTIQRLGRLLRLWKGKKPKLADFVDDEVETLASRASERRRVYKETGLLEPSARTT